MAHFKPIHSLVLDANPLLRNDPPISTLLIQAHNLYTIPAIIDEIRDQEARTRIQTTVLPFLKLRTPKAASIKLITDFARRTGDLEVLSRPDLQILALAYELEVERNEGDWRLRNTPGQARINGPMPQGLDDRHRREAEEMGDSNQNVMEINPTNDKGEQTKIIAAVDAAAGTEPTEQSHLQAAVTATTLDTLVNNTLMEECSDASDSEGWITPSNLEAHQEADSKMDLTPQSELTTMQVATITTDYAMQNILLRMNLNLLSLSLMRIKQLKTYILRCHACFTTTKDMTRQFCKKCGGATLLRTSCSTDANGTFRIHLKKNMQWNNRGNVFSIPKPTAGSSNGKRSIGGGQGHWGMNLILAEDQPEYQKLLTEESRRKNKDLMDEDFLPDLLSGGRRGPQGRIKIGGGRNVNSKKRH